MSNAATLHVEVIRKWITEKWDINQIETSLKSSGNSEESIQLLVKEFKKEKQAKRNTAGFLYLGTGAFIGFISCLVSLINPVPELLNWFLYGLTSIAIVFLGLGLYMIFED